MNSDLGLYEPHFWNAGYNVWFQVFPLAYWKADLGKKVRPWTCFYA